MDAEKELWSEVLRQAISDIHGWHTSKQKTYAYHVKNSARNWLKSNEQAVGSFLWICHTLELDPDAVRRGVLTESTPNAVLSTIFT